MTRIRSAVAVVATLAAVLAVAALVLMARTAAGQVPPSGDPPPGGVLSEDDRRAVDARPVDRGAPAPPTDAAVDLHDPESVARAYLTAAYGARPDDAGRTHLRAAAYAAPGSPPAVVGVLVLDPPPAGAVRTASVTGLELVAAATAGGGEDGTRDGGAADVRRGYRADIATATGPPGGPRTVALAVRHVVLARQPDDTWLVTAESTAAPDLATAER